MLFKSILFASQIRNIILYSVLYFLSYYVQNLFYSIFNNLYLSANLLIFCVIITLVNQIIFQFPILNIYIFGPLLLLYNEFLYFYTIKTFLIFSFCIILLMLILFAFLRLRNIDIFVIEYDGIVIILSCLSILQIIAIFITKNSTPIFGVGIKSILYFISSGCRLFIIFYTLVHQIYILTMYLTK